MKIARYRNLKYDMEYVREATSFIEDSDVEIRLTEVVEVEFKDLPRLSIHEEKFKSLQAEEAQLRVKFNAALADISNRTKSVLASTREGES